MIFLSIGSNQNSEFGDRIYNINKTLDLLSNEKIDLLNISNIYESPSYPNKDLPKFLNIMTEINYKKNPLDLLKTILTIEKKMGRVRKKKNDPRTCDIDIVDFNGLNITLDNLNLPHPHCHERNFVLLPLKDISPNWIHPISKEKIDNLINKLDPISRNEITRLNESVKVSK